jgi:Ribonuclease G/E
MKAADVLINVTPGETRLAALEGGRLIDLVYARDIWRDRLGDIYLGRVTAISKPLNAAFVDIGAGQPGFLGASDAQIFDPASQKPEPIQRLSN